jgi:predicted aldo/keto reductase-like oxidoreductase
MPVFSCGGMRYQQSWTRGTPVSAASQNNLAATIARALDLGIDHIETARGYGTSEAQLGPALAGRPRESFKLQTKIRPTDDARDFERFLDESFAGLRTPYLDLFAFHGVNTARCLERIFKPGGCWEVIDRHRRAGRIRHVGFSTHGPTRLILEAVETGKFDYLNLHYYYVFPDNRPVLQAARRQDMGVFIISPTDKGGRLQHAPPKLRALCAPVPPMVFNDLWCLHHPEIHTLSIGASRPDDFDQHLEVLPLLADPAPNLAPIVERLEQAYTDALGADFARRWREGLRDWWEIPGGVNVRRILWLHNLARAYDLIDFAQERYSAMDPGDHWVPGAHAVDFDDAEMERALPDSPFRKEIPGLLRAAHRVLHNPAVEGLP